MFTFHDNCNDYFLEKKKKGKYAEKHKKHVAEPLLTSITSLSS